MSQSIIRSSILISSLAAAAGMNAAVAAQHLLDRVVARVNGVAITLTDVVAAVGLGIVEAGPGEDTAAATQRLIDRQLMLAEVARFAPPEPEPAALTRALDAVKARVGATLPALLESTGLDEARLRDLVRDTLRIQAYLDQRFGTTVQVTDEEVERYYREHPQEFTRNGILMAFEDASPIARQRAAALRRQTLIDQWLGDLRRRADVAVPPPLK
jgi:peptidyl-prolyl cis-trans isomerase SurA